MIISFCYKNQVTKQSYFSNYCGKCKTGKIFSYFLFFNRACPHCGHPFEKEQGHYIGAMIIAYFVTALLALPTLLLATFKFKVEEPLPIVFAGLQLLVTGPIFYRYSKLLWIHAEERFTEYLHK